MKESFRHFENKKVDLIGLGNAIVDIIVNIEDEFLEKNNLDKGSMNLINSDESQKLLENCKVIKQISGGSSANTVVCLAELGNHVQFIGRVKNDQFGDFFSDDIKKSNTIFNTPPTIEGASTAHSIILITPDAQRTMCTYLGASIEFEPEDIDFTSIKESKYLYLEGYLWDSELAKKAFNNNEDIHSLTASQIFNIDIKKINDDQRRKAKAINFGIIYGISQYGLAKQINVSNHEAEEFLNAY